MTRRRSIKLAATAAGVLGVAMALMGGCSSDNPPPELGDQLGREAAAPSPCSSGNPEPGCSCSQAGEVGECGKVIQTNGNYVTCSIGHTTCDGTVWGACAGDHVVMKSIPGHRLTGDGYKVASNTVPCTNLCDPNGCTSSQGGASDVDASGFGLADGDAGITLVPVSNNFDGNFGNGDGATCVGLQCNVVQSCADSGAGTTISGTVYDPAGVNPLYNAYVYIPVDPNAALPAFTTGPTCDTCAGASINAVSVAQTGPDGKFTLTKAPSGTNIPIVIQMGKWRRKTTIASITSCQDNPLPIANTRLPRNQFDGDGNHADIPKMAFVSGSADPFECFLLKTGIDPNEFGSSTKNSSRRIIYFNSPSSAGASIDSNYGNVVLANDSTNGVWASSTETNQYDAMLFACEGGEYDKGSTAYTNVINYANAGGRVFATHYGYVWMLYPSQWQPTGNSWYAAGHSLIGTQDPMTTNIVTSFPKGQAFGQWLGIVGAASAPNQIQLHQAREDLSGVGSGSQAWMSAYDNSTGNTYPPHLTFNTPYGADAAAQCGRVVYSDFHVSASSQVTGGGACLTNNDCGFTSTCSGVAEGTCTTDQCLSAADCPTGYSCGGGSTGTCGMLACTSTTFCRNNVSNSSTCSGGFCTCTSNNQCQSGSCVSGRCAASSCSSTGTCKKAQQCNGTTYGACAKSCTVDSDCAALSWGGGSTGQERCVGGQCQGCYSDLDCPGSTSTCSGGSYGTCSATASTFPLECAQGPLSPQEAALEFMLFDLTACVSPDSAPPPPPPPPKTVYPPATFTEDFVSNCPAGTHVQWRELDWQASIPSGGWDGGTGPNVTFQAQTVDPNDAGVADFTSATKVQVAKATTSTNLPNWDLAYIDTGALGTGAFNTANPQIASRQFLRLTITLNPSSDLQVPPTLLGWKVQYDCPPAE